MSLTICQVTGRIKVVRWKEFFSFNEWSDFAAKIGGKVVRNGSDVHACFNRARDGEIGSGIGYFNHHFKRGVLKYEA